MASGEQNDQKPGWTFEPGDHAPASSAPSHDAGPSITWTASEFIEHEKSASWYMQFGLASGLGIVIIYLITRDLFSVAVLVLFAAAFMVFAARKPKVLQYSLSNNVMQVGKRGFKLDTFKSFAVVDEGAIHSISLLPLKRFMPALTVYYAPDDEEKIVQFLGNFLPQEDHKQDSIDRFMHKIRF